MNTKTPVSLLQEMMIKNQTPPNYELIHDGSGGHQNSFTFKVSCNGLSAKGTGRCKKDAKHEAAKAMLELIAKHQSLPQLPASPAKSLVRTPLKDPLPIKIPVSANEPFRNAIGELQDLCTTNDLQSPVYKEISDVGPPHARIFTVQCVVSSFKEEGIARTKKHAKHEAANKMLAKIKEVVKDDSKENLLGTVRQDKEAVLVNEVTSSQYKQLCETPIKKVFWGLKCVDYPHHFQDSLDSTIRAKMMKKLSELADYLQGKNKGSISFENIKREFVELISSVNIELKHMMLSAKESSIYMLAMQLDTVPNIVEIGMGSTKEEAEACTLLKLVNCMMLLLQERYNL